MIDWLVRVCACVQVRTRLSVVGVVRHTPVTRRSSSRKTSSSTGICRVVAVSSCRVSWRSPSDRSRSGSKTVAWRRNVNCRRYVNWTKRTELTAVGYARRRPLLTTESYAVRRTVPLHVLVVVVTVVVGLKMGAKHFQFIGLTCQWDVISRIRCILYRGGFTSTTTCNMHAAWHCLFIPLSIKIQMIGNDLISAMVYWAWVIGRWHRIEYRAATGHRVWPMTRDPCSQLTHDPTGQFKVRVVENSNKSVSLETRMRWGI